MILAGSVTVGGEDSTWCSGDTDAVLAEVQEFFTGVRAAAHTDRFLATVLFTDIVASTERTASVGDAGWAEVLDRHDSVTTRVIGEFRGRLVKNTGDGVLALLDGPAGAVLAGAGDVWVSSVVPTLSVGSGLDFHELGTHEIKGVPGEWPLFEHVAL